MSDTGKRKLQELFGSKSGAGDLPRRNFVAEPEHELDSELIVSKGYPVEEHTVVTADGYILGMQRIPRGRNELVVLDANYSKPVVLVVHALAVSSADFVMNFPEQSLGFVLADAGYDVWLGNLRGNEYTSHLTYKKSDRKFWRFSFDEMIMYDTPSMIDAVLDRTNNTRLLYIGFSQGTQVLFGLLAQQPEYNKKLAFKGSSYLAKYWIADWLKAFAAHTAGNEDEDSNAGF
ncbi:gastric triacylglycerol lipase-like [Dermacentor variabilis]|uniref:gastric triacylglycerol lipase-like n=1 Tax=Dermacentor variabilis TaxID=34621 RepID=UPI003F5C0483